MLESVHAGEEMQSRVEREIGSVDFSLSQASRQVKSGRALSCGGTMEETARL